MAIKKRPVSPRQKMINLMYVVLMAMLALNVSSEVLDGFSLVEESLNRTTANSAKENLSIYGDFESQMKANPEKVRQWFDKATQVKHMSDSLYNLAQELKEAIVKEADGSDGDVLNIRNKEDLEAATQVMLAPGKGRGKELYNAINQGIEGVVPAHAYVLAGTMLGTALTADDVTSLGKLTTKNLNAEAFAFALAAVLRTADTFFMCHNLEL